MNVQTRIEVRAALETLSNVRSILETIRDDEQEKIDRMPEGYFSSAKGEKMQEDFDALENACNDLESIEDNLTEIALLMLGERILNSGLIGQ
jgi:hypothetical protein